MALGLRGAVSPALPGSYFRLGEGGPLPKQTHKQAKNHEVRLMAQAWGDQPSQSDM